jgi:hypothetical protein
MKTKIIIIINNNNNNDNDNHYYKITIKWQTMKYELNRNSPSQPSVKAMFVSLQVSPPLQTDKHWQHCPHGQTNNGNTVAPYITHRRVKALTHSLHIKKTLKLKGKKRKSVVCRTRFA